MVSEDDYGELERRINQGFPESWIPSDEDPLLVGKFKRLEKGTTKRGPSWIAVVETKDGKEKSVWLLGTVLRNEFRRWAPKPGEKIAVKYLGKKVGEAGQDYNGFNVQVERAERPIGWDEVGDDEEDDDPEY